MTRKQKVFLQVRLEIILEQAQMLLHMGRQNGDPVLFELVSDIRTMVETASRKAGLTTKD